MMRPLVDQLADGIRDALGDADDRTARAEGAAADPWQLLETGLALAAA
jgi:hypothetical protein